MSNARTPLAFAATTLPPLHTFVPQTAAAQQQQQQQQTTDPQQMPRMAMRSSDFAYEEELAGMSEDEGQSGTEDEGSDTGRSFAARQRPPRAVAAAAAAAAPTTAASSSSTAAGRALRRKIAIEYISDRNRRHITFSKRKAGLMKKAHELSVLTGAQVLLIVASDTNHVYTFVTPKLRPIIGEEEGRNLVQSCLASSAAAAAAAGPHAAEEQFASDEALAGPGIPSLTALAAAATPAKTYRPHRRSAAAAAVAAAAAQQQQQQQQPLAATPPVPPPQVSQQTQTQQQQQQMPGSGSGSNTSGYVASPLASPSLTGFLLPTTSPSPGGFLSPQQHPTTMLQLPPPLLPETMHGGAVAAGAQQQPPAFSPQTMASLLSPSAGPMSAGGSRASMFSPEWIAQQAPAASPSSAYSMPSFPFPTPR